MPLLVSSRRSPATLSPSDSAQCARRSASAPAGDAGVLSPSWEAGQTSQAAAASARSTPTALANAPSTTFSIPCASSPRRSALTQEATATQEARQRGSGWVVRQKASVFASTAAPSQNHATPVMAVRITPPLAAAVPLPALAHRSRATAAGSAQKFSRCSTALVCAPRPAPLASPSSGKPRSFHATSRRAKSCSSARPPDANNDCKMSMSWSVSSVQSPGAHIARCKSGLTLPPHCGEKG
mmetsp:Transcript_62959/g.148322  ORF Transcript_62959/g.148322 Transcript_62959/m.148322 type:complete len:240 (-) Transcript_62959:461-1180(-)